MAMSREQLSELLSAYIDGEVDSREKATVEIALRADPGARKLLEELRRTAAAVAALPRHAAPPTLAADLDTQLERAQLLSGFDAGRHRSPTRKVGWHSPMKAAAMLAVVVGAGWWFLSVQKDERGSKEFTTVSKTIIPDGATTEADLGFRSRAEANLDVESRLAAGVDPVVLVNQSFEPEPIRLRVIAKDAAERDALSKQFTAQLADARTENLARRSQAAPNQNKPAGAFYLEGKPGVNYVDSRETQILVRMPSEQVQSVVDQVASSVRTPADQLNLRAGAISVQGAEKSRGLLQVLADKDKADSPTSRENLVAAAAPPVRSRPRGLVDTLGEIVGLGSLADEAAARTDTSSNGAAAPAERLAMAEREARDSGDRDDAVDKKEAKEKAPPSLVDRRWEEARTGARGANGEKTIADVAQPAAEGFNALSASNRFITMVVEFALPAPKTLPKNGSDNRPR